MFAPKLQLIAAAALSAAALTSSPAFAYQAESQSVVVSFADLNLDQPTGMARLNSRLKSAAKQVCDTATRDIHARRLDAECRAKALDHARTEVASMTRTGGADNEVALARR
jgi:UrcA family protein